MPRQRRRHAESGSPSPSLPASLLVRGQFNVAFSNWLWSWRLLPLRPTLLHLAETLAVAEPNSAAAVAAHYHLEYLLVQDLALKNRLEWLSSVRPAYASELASWSVLLELCLSLAECDACCGCWALSACQMVRPLALSGGPVRLQI